MPEESQLTSVEGSLGAAGRLLEPSGLTGTVPVCPPFAPAAGYPEVPEDWPSPPGGTWDPVYCPAYAASGPVSILANSKILRNFCLKLEKTKQTKKSKKKGKNLIFWLLILIDIFIG